MNIAAMMIPKISTVFLHETDTLRQGLEQFSAPVLLYIILMRLQRFFYLLYQRKRMIKTV